MIDKNEEYDMINESIENNDNMKDLLLIKS